MPAQNQAFPEIPSAFEINKRAVETYLLRGVRAPFDRIQRWFAPRHQIPASTLSKSQQEELKGLNWTPLIFPTALQKMLAPVSRPKWICEELFLAPGRPTLVSAYSYSGKTLSMQSLAVSVASETPIWGQFSCHQGKVRHIDYEQGENASITRYQRLIKGMGLDHRREEIMKNIELFSFPPTYLSETKSYKAFSSFATGAQVVIIDSLKAATPGAEENSSSFRVYIDILSRISQELDCAFILVHHAGKAKEGQTDARQSMRGSSSILDASGTSFTMLAQKGKPARVSMIKASADAEGCAQEDFYLGIEDVAIDNNQRAGLRVKHLTLQQQEEREAAEAEAPSEQVERMAKQMLASLREDPGQTASMLRMSVGGAKSLHRPALDMLLTRGMVRKDKERAGGKGAPERLYVAALAES